MCRSSDDGSDGSPTGAARAPILPPHGGVEAGRSVWAPHAPPALVPPPPWAPTAPALPPPPAGYPSLGLYGSGGGGSCADFGGGAILSSRALWEAPFLPAARPMEWAPRAAEPSLRLHAPAPEAAEPAAVAAPAAAAAAVAAALDAAAGTADCGRTPGSHPVGCLESKEAEVAEGAAVYGRAAAAVAPAGPPRGVLLRAPVGGSARVMPYEAPNDGALPPHVLLGIPVSEPTFVQLPMALPVEMMRDRLPSKSSVCKFACEYGARLLGGKVQGGGGGGGRVDSERKLFAQEASHPLALTHSRTPARTRAWHAWRSVREGVWASLFLVAAAGALIVMEIRAARTYAGARWRARALNYASCSELTRPSCAGVMADADVRYDTWVAPAEPLALVWPCAKFELPMGCSARNSSRVTSKDIKLECAITEDHGSIALSVLDHAFSPRRRPPPARVLVANDAAADDGISEGQAAPSPSLQASGFLPASPPSASRWTSHTRVPRDDGADDDGSDDPDDYPPRDDHDRRPVGPAGAGGGRNDAIPGAGMALEQGSYKHPASFQRDCSLLCTPLECRGPYSSYSRADAHCSGIMLVALVVSGLVALLRGVAIFDASLRCGKRVMSAARDAPTYVAALFCANRTAYSNMARYSGDEAFE
jgi:hypothetical protein